MALIVVALTVLVTHLRAQDLSFVQFAASDVDYTVARTGNRSGTIVGRVEIGDKHRAFVYDGTAFTLFDAPGSSKTQAYGINDRGDITGLFYDAENQFHGFLRTAAGEISQIDVPGATGTVAGNINDAGDIVGHYQDASGKLKGYVRTGDRFELFEVEGARWTVPYGINNKGTVAGWYSLSEGQFGSFLYDISTRSITLVPDVPGVAATVIWEINDAGDMAGFTNDEQGRHKGLVIRGGTPRVFELGTAGETVPFGITEDGRIIGFYDKRGFLTTTRP